MKKIQNGGKLNDLPLSSRPREKLIARGSGNLNTAELLAILFSTGTKRNNALALGEIVIRKYPPEKLSKLTHQELTVIPGIGNSKATRVLAALELGRRLFEPAAVTKIHIRTLQDTLQVIREYADKKQEYLVCLYINARHELLLKEVIGMGSLNSLRVEPREVFRPAFTTPCAGIIIVHNHPSGDTSPSEDDIHFTKRIQEAGEVLGIPLLDHVIISAKSYYSFRDTEDGKLETQ